MTRLFKTLIVYISLITCALNSNAQQNQYNRIYPLDLETATFIDLDWAAKPLNSPSDILEFAAKAIQISDNSNYALKIIASIDSPQGKHITLLVYYKGVEIFRSQVKINLDKQGKVTSMFSSFKPLQQGPDIEYSQFSGILPPEEIYGGSRVEKTPVIVIQDGKEETAIRIEFLNKIGNHVAYLINRSGKIIYYSEKSMHFAPQDTLADAFVFLPDPITSAETNYGGPYVDNNDQTNSFLDAERANVEIEVTFDNGTFTMENQYLKITEHSLPVVPPATSTTPEFLFDRSEGGFEDAMAMYHITVFQKYLRQLGFTNIVDYQIHVDTHGFDGADQSSFNAFTNPPSLTFGIGGVDDAEDADVIIHEYGHGVMHSAAPNTNAGTERRALDEGMCDYFASSYSKAISTYRYDWVFNWDGHNEFWPGRFTTTNQHYPEDLTFNLYGDAPIWSATMMRLESFIGRNVLTEILIESAYSYAINMTMTQAADLLIDADSLVNNGANYAYVCHILKDRGLTDTCYVARPPLGILPVAFNTFDSYKIYNSLQFAEGTGNLVVQSDIQQFELKIYNLKGQLIKELNTSNQTISVSPEYFKRGMYILVISGNGKVQTEKISRF